MAGATILYVPLRVTIDDVAAQPVAPLPDVFRVALRYALSTDGSPWHVRLQAARQLAARGARDGIMRLIDPLFLAMRLAAFTDIAQSEHFLAQSFRARCWTKGFSDLTVPAALYLAARAMAPAIDDDVFIRNQMARIAARALAADEKLGPAFIAAAEGPLPTCN
jgi:hypothetical protein